MPGYEKHLKFGWITHFIMSVILLPSLYLIDIPIEAAVGVITIALPITLFASTLPDVDHHSSNSNTLFRYFIFIISVCLTSILLGQYLLTIGLLWLSFIDTVPYLLILSTIVFVSLVVGSTVLIAFKRFRPSHRGITHSIPFVAFTTITVGLTSWIIHKLLIPADLPELTAVTVSAFFLAGIVSHLKLDDEIM